METKKQELMGKLQALMEEYNASMVPEIGIRIDLHEVPVPVEPTPDSTPVVSPETPSEATS